MNEQRTVLYMAHPLGKDVDGNIKRALRWLSWLRRSFSGITFVAPWIAGVLSVGGDGTEEDREAGLVDDCAIVAKLDGVVLVGGHVSSGMARERDAAIASGNPVHDLTWIGEDSPPQPKPSSPSDPTWTANDFATWAAMVHDFATFPEFNGES